MVNFAFNLGSSYFMKYDEDIYCNVFVEPVVCLFVMSMCVYSLSAIIANLILLDIYSLKFLRSFFFAA